MSKKTKKQKVAAASRKHLMYQKLFESTSSTQSLSDRNIIDNHLIQHKISPTEIKTSNGTSDYQLNKNFIEDFTRSFVLIIAIITLEIILYFVSMKANIL